MEKLNPASFSLKEEQVFNGNGFALTPLGSAIQSIGMDVLWLSSVRSGKARTAEEKDAAGRVVRESQRVEIKSDREAEIRENISRRFGEVADMLGFGKEVLMRDVLSQYYKMVEQRQGIVNPAALRKLEPVFV